MVSIADSLWLTETKGIDGNWEEVETIESIKASATFFCPLSERWDSSKKLDFEDFSFFGVDLGLSKILVLVHDFLLNSAVFWPFFGKKKNSLFLENIEDDYFHG